MRLLIFIILSISVLIAEDASARNLRVSHRIQDPLKYASPGAVFVTSGLTADVIEYSQRFNSGKTRVGLSWQQVERNLTIRDTSDLTLDLQSTRPASFGFSLQHKDGPHQIRIRTWQSRARALDSMDIEYALEVPNMVILSGMSSRVSAWDLALTDRTSLVLASSNYGSLDLRAAIMLKLKYITLALAYEQAVGGGLFLDKSADIHLDLKPIHRGYSLRFSRALGQDRRATLYFAALDDTLNSHIYRGTGIIGDIYAFDQRNRRAGVVYSHRNSSFSLTYNVIDLRMSGSVLASHFSDLLSGLSGARYYQQMELNAQYMDIQTTLRDLAFRNVSLGINNSIFIGQGRIYSKRYSFLLFNPLSDLSIQEISINRAIVDRINIDLKIHLFHKIDLTTRARYYVPISLDVETKPQLEIQDADLVFDRFFEIELNYSF
ncbi:MAG: hypothetical protein K9N38_10285 [Candidatus Marinimicrobia bacterium]|nr:hypothetical protein [Candidatus Neomarinimicrobiota bacterium]